MKRIALPATTSFRNGLLGVKRVVFPLLAALALSGCKPAATSAPASAERIAGLYRLVAVDGKPVPTTVSHGGHELEVRSGSFTIQTNGTCSSHMVFVPPSGAEATRDVTATFTQEAGTLRMRWEGAGRTVGKVEGATFTMTNEGMVLVYQR